MNFEKCEPAKATHVMLANGKTKCITERRAGSPWDLGFRLENQNPFVSVEAIECLGGFLVRKVDDTSEPWTTELVPFNNDNGVPVVYLPDRFKDRPIRCRIEMVKPS